MNNDLRSSGEMRRLIYEDLLTHTTDEFYQKWSRDRHQTMFDLTWHLPEETGQTASFEALINKFNKFKDIRYWCKMSQEYREQYFREFIDIARELYSSALKH